MRVSNVARSSDWIRASWRNQSGRYATVDAAAGAPDIDGDLLPDAWEMEHFGSIHMADGAGGSDSSVFDLLAFATGTGPNDPESFPFVVLDSDSGEEVRVYPGRCR